ncbi:MAG TPA: helicase, partial [Puia sp.]|nr:helicase [Puia sp.]
TFLKKIREDAFKNIAVVAPTGVAAINAGGVTMHSFFQLPFRPFIPVRTNAWEQQPDAVDEYALIKNIRFGHEKRELLRELDLLVIDEVSMLRADMLDAIDRILRYFRFQPNLPFGGLQVLYIGDLFQLPPVVVRNEWDILREHYKSPFFFDAHVIQQAPPVYLELKKIYRQSDADFIHILNNIRNNQVSYEDLETLHQHYSPSFKPTQEENYITLTTHNSRADLINKQELDKLPGPIFVFEGKIEREFEEKALPAEKILGLKPGAQIMFIKNDKGEDRRYFNGKIGKITRIKGDEIFIGFEEEKEELLLEKETWKNIRYYFNKEKGKIEEETLGEFTQYPIRLAWAITIHKSQGLTFEKAIIDAGASFAPGQVYVALSRLTSMNGLVLYSRIRPDCIQTDPRIVEFAKTELGEEELQAQFLEEQK